MVELTLDDLMRWQPGRFRLLQPAGEPREVLAVELSWAVTIRAGTPVLPRMSGGELVIVPVSRLQELRAREEIGWRQILEQLLTLGPAGVLTDDTALSAPPPGLVFLMALQQLPDDIESRLNREIIERRGALYQLGSELARELSAASIRGSNLEALLEVAATTGGIAVALVAGSGAPIARSSPDLLPEGLPVDPERPGIPFLHDGLEWVSQPVRSLALPEGVMLVGGLEPEAPADRARLVLEQTAESLGMLFDRLPPVEALAPQREIERLLLQIVVQDNLTPVARRRFAHLRADLGLEGALRLVAELDAPVAPAGAARALAFQHAGLHLRIVGDKQAGEILRAAQPAVLSAPVSGVDDLAGLLPAVQGAARLMRAGIIPPGTVDLGEPWAGSAAVALLLATLASQQAGDALRGFACARLAPLVDYDRARGAELVRTLAAYLDAGASVAAAARDLDVHRNTLAYRIARIEEVGGVDLDDPATRFELQLAVMLRRVLEEGDS